MPLRRVQRIDTDHGDVIHDVAYDHYGARLATCSSDMCVRVFDQGRLVAAWKAHDGSVWRVAWAHPEFGQILATCSYDRAVHVYEEPAAGPDGPGGGAPPWARRARLLHAGDEVTDIAFAPKHLGLRLAAAAADGHVRVYEALDAMKVDQWDLVHDIAAPAVTCVSWCPALAGPQALALGHKEGRVGVWAFSDSTRAWQEEKAWTDHHGDVHSVSWAPSVGRAHHLVASGSQDRTVRIARLTPPSGGGGGGGGWQATTVATLRDHRQQVWRVEWNLTGTLLASSGDDGAVRVWRSDQYGEWSCVSVVDNDGKPSG